MKKLIKANPMGVALVIVFLLLIVIGVMTTKGAERRSQGRRPASGIGGVALAGNFA